MKQFFVICAILYACSGYSQKVAHAESFRDMENGRYFRFNYDNDFFASTDKYYTQGINLEVVLPALKSNPANYILIIPSQNENRYGLSVEHLAYTASTILIDEIRYGDRPFSAVIFLKSFAISIDPVSKSRWSSSFSIGMIGPAAFGGEIQRSVHEWTDNPTPRGWQHQISNDLVVQYGLGYEKQLLHLDRIASLNAVGSANFGSLFINASAGINSSVGLIGNSFGNGAMRRFQIFAFAQLQINAIGYDVTLLGGIFNDSSPHTISEKNIERIVFQSNFGIVAKYRGWYFEFSHTVMTREFKLGRPHRYGGLKLGFNL